MAEQLRAIEGKYEILAKISEGGMGAVYKVRHRLLDRVRVIKVMRPQLAADEEMKARFLREAQLAARLRHPCIAEVYDFAVEEDGSAFLVLEYIRGVTLEETLRRLGPPDVAFTLAASRQCLDALGYLHGKGIIHRDLSPDNIMLTRDEHGHTVAKLIDLGIAKLVGSSAGLTQAGAFIGKVKYASPELFRGKEGVPVDRRSDLYSFGLVLYESLTGVHPFGSDDVSGYIASHLFHPPRSFADVDPEGRVPEDLREIVLTALAKNADERFPEAATFAAALAAVERRYPSPPDELGRALQAGGDADDGHAAEGHGSTQAHLDRRFAPLPTGARLGAGADLGVGPTVNLGMVTAPVDGALAPAPGAPAMARRAPAADRPRSWRAAAVLAGLAVVAGVVTTIARWPAPASEPAAPARATGVMVIDALPWGEIASIVDGEGRPFAVDGTPATPVRLEVPAGTYRVVLVHRDQQRELTVEVTGDGTVERTARFSEADPDALLASLGF